MVEGALYFLIHPSNPQNKESKHNRTLCYFTRVKNRLQRRDILTEQDDMVTSAGTTHLRNNQAFTFERASTETMQEIFERLITQSGIQDPHQFLMSIARLKGVAEQLPESEASNYFRAMVRAETAHGIDGYD